MRHAPPARVTVYTSLVIAMIIPITTNTTIAICIQIQVGDTTDSLPGATIV